MTDDASTIPAESAPTYVVVATEQQDAWHLTVDLPGAHVGHVVRSVDDPEWVLTEVRSIVAARLYVPDDSFNLVLQVGS